MRPEDRLKGQTIQEVTPPSEIVRNEDKIQLVLAYLFPLSLIPLLTVKDSDYVKWHARNGLVFGLASWLALSVLGAVAFPLGCLATCAVLVVDIVAMVKSLNGVRWRIPLVSDLAEKL